MCQSSVLKSPNKEIQDPSESTNVKEDTPELTLSQLLPSPKKEPTATSEQPEDQDVREEDTVFGKMLLDAAAHPELDSQRIYIRNMGGPGAEAELLEHRRKPYEFHDRLIAWAKTKSRKWKKLELTKKTNVVSGKRDRKKTWKQMDQEEMVKKEGARKPAPKTALTGPEEVPASVMSTKGPAKRGRPAKKAVEASSQDAEQSNEVPSTSDPSPSSSTTTEPRPKKAKQTFTCPECHKTAKSGTCRCNGCNEWIHLKCAGISQRQWTEQFRCSGCS